MSPAPEWRSVFDAILINVPIRNTEAFICALASTENQRVAAIHNGTVHGFVEVPSAAPHHGLERLFLLCAVWRELWKVLHWNNIRWEAVLESPLCHRGLWPNHNQAGTKSFTSGNYKLRHMRERGT